MGFNQLKYTADLESSTNLSFITFIARNIFQESEKTSTPEEGLLWTNKKHIDYGLNINNGIYIDKFARYKKYYFFNK